MSDDEHAPHLLIGSSGPAVEELQRILVNEGFLVMRARSGAAVPFGYFGGLTESALVHFQQTHQDPATGSPLEVTGIPDHPTWRALRAPSGEPQRAHLAGTIPAGLTPERDAVLSTCRLFHAFGVRESPNGSNRSPAIDTLVPEWARGQPWCAWAAWTLTRRALSRPVLGLERSVGSSHRTYRLALERGAWRAEDGTYEPIPGDMFVMLYRDSAGRLTGRGHTGIVAATQGAEIGTWEGNAGNRFKLGRRRRDTIAGYVNHYGAEEQPIDWERGLPQRAVSTGGSATV